MTRRPRVFLGALALSVAACHGPERSALPADAPKELRQAAASCDDGDVHACTNVAAAWRDGTLTPPDPARALALLDRACAGGAHVACIALADEEGDAAARTRLSATCASYAPACLRLGDRAAGDDPAAAYQAYRAGCDGRVIEACTSAALALRDGSGVSADPEAALELLVATCGDGSTRACREQALTRIAAGEAPEALRELMNGACFGGDGPACAWVAALLEDSDTPSERSAATTFHERACDLGEAASCAVAEGSGVPSEGSGAAP